MKTIKEILQLVIDNHTPNTGGICGVLSVLYSKDIITRTEYYSALRYVQNHRPSWYQKYYSSKLKYSMYYWEPFVWDVRVKWLQHHIKKLSK